MAQHNQKRSCPLIVTTPSILWVFFCQNLLSGGIMATKQLTPIQGVVHVSVIYDEKKYKIVQKSLTSSQFDNVKGKLSNVKIDRLMTFFKVTDLQGNPVTSFSPAIRFRIEYSASNWKKALKNNKDQKFKRPRIAYLARRNKKWDARWVEFKKTNISSFKPPKGNTNGELVLTIKKIPDPLIGGC